VESASIANVKIQDKRDFSWLDKLAKKAVLAVCKRLQRGHLTIEDNGEVYRFGEPAEKAEIIAHIQVHQYSAYRDVFFHGSIGSGEAYMRGAWTSPDLLNVIQLWVANAKILDKMDNERPWISRFMAKILHSFNENSRFGSRKNISAHYDLGNDFFKLFLDKTMMYSSAVFPEKTSTLEEGSLHKLELLCQKLQLTDSDHLLEIGTGWGGLAVYAAKNYGCKVTTTTISKEQHDYAQQRVDELGLQNQVTVLLEDYRDLRGQYDKLVSVEMIEAVGHEYYADYFSRCSQLLKAGGLMAIQAITISDQRYQQAKQSVDFIQRYIFPGGCLPSNEVIASCVSRHTDMHIIDLQDITAHYARTLRLWREAFFSELEQVKTQGFDDVFCRMWEFYLCYCEGGFRERVISTGQFVFAKPDYRFS
jgi:cyclopropane-fatty-acyl-phospholipid synthase (EC 2.1.1.79)